MWICRAAALCLFLLQVTQRMVWLFGTCPARLRVLVFWTDPGQRASQLKRSEFPFSLQTEHRIKGQKEEGVFEEAPGDVREARHCRGRHGTLGAVPFLTCWLEHLSAANAFLRVAWSNWFPPRVIGCLIPTYLHCLQKGKLRQTGLSRARMCCRNGLSHQLSLLELELLILVGEQGWISLVLHFRNHFPTEGMVVWPQF